MNYPMTALLLLPLAIGVSASACGDDPKEAGPDIVIVSELFPGTAKILGTITLPSAVSSSTSVQLGLIQAVENQLPGLPPFTGNEMLSQGLNRQTDRILYEIRNLADGSWAVFCRVDATHDLAYGPGDLGGYYPGTVDSPVQNTSLAQTIEVTGAQPTVADFGLGLINQ